jgi:hypothetical protein
VRANPGVNAASSELLDAAARRRPDVGDRKQLLLGPRRKDITRSPALRLRRLRVIGRAGLRWRLSGSRRWLTWIYCSRIWRGADWVSQAVLVAVGQVSARARGADIDGAYGEPCLCAITRLQVLTAPAPLVPTRSSRSRHGARGSAADFVPKRAVLCRATDPSGARHSAAAVNRPTASLSFGVGRPKSLIPSPWRGTLGGFGQQRRMP